MPGDMGGLAPLTSGVLQVPIAFSKGNLCHSLTATRQPVFLILPQMEIKRILSQSPAMKNIFQLTLSVSTPCRIKVSRGSRANASPNTKMDHYD